jgi:hypothetical protein
LGADPIGKAAEVANDRRHILGAEIAFAAQTLFAMHATPRTPADPHALADLEAFCRRAKRDDAANDFVAGNDGVT